MSQRKRLGDSQNSSQPRKRNSNMVTQEAEDVSLTQPSSSQVLRALEKLTPAQVDHKVAEVVQYLLVKDQKKVPLRRADIVKQVLKEYKNAYSEIMNRVSQTLEQVFGFEIVEIDPKSHMYILVNKLAAAKGNPEVHPPNPKKGLLFVILGVIFMKGGILRENIIWKVLKTLRVNPEERHEVFGDVKKLITEEFVRQKASFFETIDSGLYHTREQPEGEEGPVNVSQVAGYLEYNRILHTDPVEHEFQWGERANLELSKPQVLEFMGEIYNQDPQSWSQRYKEAHSSNDSSQASSSQRSTAR